MYRPAGVLNCSRRLSWPTVTRKDWAPTWQQSISLETVNWKTDALFPKKHNKSHNHTFEKESRQDISNYWSNCHHIWYSIYGTKEVSIPYSENIHQICMFMWINICPCHSLYYHLLATNLILKLIIITTDRSIIFIYLLTKTIIASMECQSTHYVIFFFHICTSLFL